MFTRITRIRPIIERCPRNHPESRMQSGFRYEFFIRRTWPRHRNEISALKATLVEKFRIPLVILPSPPLPFPPSVQVASIVNFKKISNLLHWERAESIAKIKRNNFYLLKLSVREHSFFPWKDIFIFNEGKFCYFVDISRDNGFVI